MIDWIFNNPNVSVTDLLNRDQYKQTFKDNKFSVINNNNFFIPGKRRSVGQ